MAGGRRRGRRPRLPRCAPDASRVERFDPHRQQGRHLGGAGLNRRSRPDGRRHRRARAELISHGVDVSEVFHDAGGSLGGGFIAVPEARAPGHDPQRRSYASYASFSDPDGNRWLLQEITNRLPGRIDSNATTFTSASGLASALRRAAAAHGEHEKRTGQHDAEWPDWYAAYIAAEQSGAPLPS